MRRYQTLVSHYHCPTVTTTVRSPDITCCPYAHTYYFIGLTVAVTSLPEILTVSSEVHPSGCLTKTKINKPPDIPLCKTSKTSSTLFRTSTSCHLHEDLVRTLHLRKNSAALVSYDESWTPFRGYQLRHEPRHRREYSRRHQFLQSWLSYLPWCPTPSQDAEHRLSLPDNFHPTPLSKT